MKSLQNTAVYMAIPPVSANSGAYTSLAVDTCPGGIPCSSVRVVVGCGVVGSAATVLSVGTSTTPNGSYTAITGADWIAAGSAAATANQVFVCDINWEPGAVTRGRYIKVAATGGSTTLLFALVILGDFNQAPNSAAEIGAGITGNTATTSAVTTAATGNYLVVT